MTSSGKKSKHKRVRVSTAKPKEYVYLNEPVMFVADLARLLRVTRRKITEQACREYMKGDRRLELIDREGAVLVARSLGFTVPPRRASEPDLELPEISNASPHSSKPQHHSHPLMDLAQSAGLGSYGGLFPGLTKYDDQRFVSIVYVDRHDDQITLNAMTPEMAAVFAAYLVGYSCMAQPHRAPYFRYIFEKTLSDHGEEKIRACS